MRRPALALLLLLALDPPATAGISASDVDVALVLVRDISDSMSGDSYRLEAEGLASGITNPEIVDAISNGALGRIAVTVVDFGSYANIVVPWTTVSDKRSARELASSILSVHRNRDSVNLTSISSGLSLADSLIATMPYTATRRVVDISGDGRNNYDDPSTGIDLPAATARAKELKITVNGLPIHGEEEDVEQFYRDWVITGPGAFLIPAANPRDFARAIRRKLVREIS